MAADPTKASISNPPVPAVVKMRAPTQTTSSQAPGPKTGTAKPKAPRSGFSFEGPSKDFILGNLKFLVHIGDGPGAEHHIDLWRDFFAAAGAPFAVVFRNYAVYTYVQNTVKDTNLIYVQGQHEVADLIARSGNLIAVFYVANTGNVLHFTQVNELRHIFIGHGDSEKASSCSKFFRVYDEIWTAGQAHVDRFNAASFNQNALRFRIVGRPALKWPILNRQQRPRGRFIYLPTWEGFQEEQNYCSMHFAEQIITAAVGASGKPGMIKAHPGAGRRIITAGPVENIISQNLTSAGVEHEVIERGASVWPYMWESDFLISDISSVVSDYLATLNPIFLFIPNNPNLKVSESVVPFDRYAYVFSDRTELIEMLDRVIVNGDDYLKNTRKEAMEYFIGVRETLGDTFSQRLIDLINPDLLSILQQSLVDSFNSNTLISGHGQRSTKVI